MRIFKISMLTMAMLAGPAWAGGPGYEVTLAAPAAKERIVAHGLLWRCADTRCMAAAGNSRPLIVCQALAREAGPVTSFRSGGDALAAEQLARCNGQAADARMARAD